MPEICEVCLTAEILNKKLKGKTLTKIIITGGRYKKKKPDGYKDFELPLKLEKVNSKGKFMWFEFENENYIFNTFGLEGKWSFTIHKHADVEFQFDNVSVWFVDSMHYGSLKFVDSAIKLDKKLKTLGPDFLKEDMTLTDFKKRFEKIKNKTKTIIEVLMHQKWIGSGIGNYLVAEILYKAKISPHQTIECITSKQYKSLYDSIRELIKECYINNPVEKYIKYLADELINLKKSDYLPDVKIKKGKFTFKVYKEPKDPNGNPVIKEEIVKKRTSHWVPKIQKELTCKIV